MPGNTADFISLHTQCNFLRGTNNVTGPIPSRDCPHDKSVIVPQVLKILLHPLPFQTQTFISAPSPSNIPPLNSSFSFGVACYMIWNKDQHLVLGRTTLETKEGRILRTTEGSLVSAAWEEPLNKVQCTHTHYFTFKSKVLYLVQNTFFCSIDTQKSGKCIVILCPFSSGNSSEVLISKYTRYYILDRAEREAAQLVLN